LTSIKIIEGEKTEENSEQVHVQFASCAIDHVVKIHSVRRLGTKKNVEE
jgi:hypothetical protein